MSGLAHGERLGPYEILAQIGAGGMGAVYKAHDTRLGRDVAIKICSARFSERFEREARAIAALNHPNICTLYDVAATPSGQTYLVMELIDGETLKAPLPVNEALRCASQIAQAMEAAHDKGITHRDLKPGNVMITRDGLVKMLDFGLAAIQAPPVPSGHGADPENSPTLTIGATQAGVVLGTAAYMSPEQASAQKVDKRADIWSFGVVLWEMLTGERLFAGETVSHVLAAVLNREIDFAKLPAATPPAIRTLLRRCLDRDVKNRLRDIGEARIAIENCGKEPEVKQIPVKPNRIALGWAAVATVAAIALGFVSYFHSSPEPPRVVKMSVLPPEKSALRWDIPAVSPDGQRVAFTAALDGKISLWVRGLDSLEARPLPETEGASLPFWSPDSRFVAFFANGKLKKTDAAGGAVQTLCDAADGRGGTWNQNDVILFAAAIVSPIYRVPAAGGTPVAVTTIGEQEPGHRFPSFLPDGRHFLYTAYGQSRDEDMVYVADLESKTRRALIPATSNVVYASPGYLLFLRELTLMAQPFDAGKLQTTGDAVPVAEHIGYTAIDIRAFFSASQNGVLVYDSPLSDASNQSGNSQLTWFDRSGKMNGTVGAPGGLLGSAISANGNSVAMTRRDLQSGLYDIWLYDLARGTNSRFTFNSQNNIAPVWSPDGSHIAFYSTPGGASAVYQRASSGAGPDEILDKSTDVKAPVDWSRDGRYIIEQTLADTKTGYDVWVLPLFGDKKPFPYLRTNANERSPKLSPNGQWLAYQSDETKQNEIYVTTFPQPGGKWQVSTNGGSDPVWSRDGKELFYLSTDGKMMAVDVKTSPKFDAGVPKPLFDIRVPAPTFGSSYDVGKDGRFLIPVPVEQGGKSGSAPITVVLNWTAGLKK